MYVAMPQAGVGADPAAAPPTAAPGNPGVSAAHTAVNIAIAAGVGAAGYFSGRAVTHRAGNKLRNGAIGFLVAEVAVFVAAPWIWGHLIGPYIIAPLVPRY